ncbi:uncharacterized protein [Parasteatoda tepidariorum]|uniref:uncharacterized protein n=1 Tax=Parasteatoda tepidariorum TaxID=114398 RepID=UPI00077FC825|nr:uncharacterized protein LOC107442337 [Parasteatoda tepidariorum]
MNAIWIIFAFCVLSATAQTTQPQSGPEIICDKVTDEISAEFDKCNKLDPKHVQKLVSDCQLEQLPNEEVKAKPYFEAGCKDNSIFRKFAKCVEENSKDMKASDFEAGTKCYYAVADKYNLDWP